MVKRRGTNKFLEKDIKKRQLCRVSSFSSGKYLFEHVVHVKSYLSIVHLGLMSYLTLLYPEEIRAPKSNCV